MPLPQLISSTRPSGPAKYIERIMPWSSGPSTGTPWERRRSRSASRSSKVSTWNDTCCIVPAVVVPVGLPAWVTPSSVVDGLDGLWTKAT